MIAGSELFVRGTKHLYPHRLRRRRVRLPEHYGTLTGAGLASATIRAMRNHTARFSCRVVAAALVCSGVAFAQSDAWSRFRGPNGSGVVDVGGLPTEIDETHNVLWRTPLAPGHSSPVLTAKQIFLTAIEDDALWTIALDRGTGEELWRQEAPRERKDQIDGRNNAASPSPVVDDDVVIVFFQEFGLLAYDHSGEPLWEHPLEPFHNVYGMGASPILIGDTVFLACDQSLGSYLLALDKKSGAQRWRVDRPTAKSGHCTPIVIEGAGGAPELILPGSFYLDAYDPKSGERKWWTSGLCFEMKSVPIYSHGLIFTNGYGSPMNQPGNQIQMPPFDEVLASNDANEDGVISEAEMPASRASSWFGFVDLDANGTLDADDWSYLSDALASQNGMLAFRPGKEGDCSQGALAWSYRRAVPQLPSPLVYDDVLYMLNDAGGLITTFRPESGEQLEHGRLEGALDTYYASPVAGDGKVYLVSEHGTVVVLGAGGSLEPLFVGDFGERVYATPALSQGRIYLRTEAALYAFGEDAGSVDEE